MNIYEQYGRLTEQYQQECQAHQQTVGVLRALKLGQLSIDALTVGDDNSWQIDAAGLPAIVTVEPSEDAKPS